MAAVDLRQVFRNLVYILFLDRRQEARASDGCGPVVDGHARQAAVIWRERNSRKIQQCGNILVIIELETMGIDAVVTEAELVDHARGESVRLTECHAAIRIILIAILKRPAIECIVER